MLTLFQEPQLAEQMGTKGYEKLLAKFAIERVAQDMEALHETALA